MKLFFWMLAGCVFLFTSCEKKETYRGLPGIEGGRVADSLTALRAWVEQIAIEKRDSIRRLDSIANLTNVVDTNSLFHKKNMMVALVEVNDHYFPNVNCLKDQDGKPIFDLAFPFSANLNIDPGTGKPYVSYNPQHQAMLRNGTFRVVQNAGIPVGLSLLGNHDAAGLANFPNLAEATAFAQLVAIEVRKVGYSAVLFDNEYSDRPSVTPDPNSYLMVVSEIKRLLPDVFLCFYDFGGGASGTYNGKRMGDIADAIFPDYGATPSVYGFPKEKGFYSYIEAGSSNPPLATAQMVRQQGYRGMMFFNVTGRSSVPAYYGPLALALKNKILQVQQGCLNPNEFAFVNGQ